jgi:hypothetical protein
MDGDILGGLVNCEKLIDIFPGLKLVWKIF